LSNGYERRLNYPQSREAVPFSACNHENEKLIASVRRIEGPVKGLAEQTELSTTKRRSTRGIKFTLGSFTEKLELVQ
jgi:hypothetical protein